MEAEYQLTADAREFRQNIRAYNNAFAFTSLGTSGPADPIMRTAGPPVFKVGGELYHRIGSLLPRDDSDPQFLQAYILDGSEAARSRTYSLRQSTIRVIESTLQRVNPYVRVLLDSRERLLAAGLDSVHLVVRTLEPQAASRDANRYKAHCL